MLTRTPSGGDRLLPVRDRLMSRIRQLPNGCWEWTGKITASGHGAVGYRGHRHVLAHRAVYTEFVGEIPQGLTLDHLCHTQDTSCHLGKDCPHRRCVNPAHLEPVTLSENTKRGGESRVTHCPKGHPYSAENTLVSNNRRYCRTCQKVHADRNTARIAAARVARQRTTESAPGKTS